MTRNYLILPADQNTKSWSQPIPMDCTSKMIGGDEAKPFPAAMRKVNRFVMDHPDDDQLHYSWEVLGECTTFEWYAAVAEYATTHRKSAIVDIGCSYGLQGAVSLEMGMPYIGVDIWIDENMYSTGSGNLTPRYIEAKYPAPLDIPANALAVSHLCVGWPCFFWTDEEMRNVFRQLATDFDQAVLYIPPETLQYVSDFFTYKAFKPLAPTKFDTPTFKNTYLLTKHPE